MGEIWLVNLYSIIHDYAENMVMKEELLSEYGNYRSNNGMSSK